MNQSELTAALQRRYDASAEAYREALLVMSSGQVLGSSTEEYHKLEAKLEAAALTCADRHYALALNRFRVDHPLAAQ